MLFMQQPVYRPLSRTNKILFVDKCKAHVVHTTAHVFFLLVTGSSDKCRARLPQRDQRVVRRMSQLPWGHMPVRDDLWYQRARGVPAPPELPMQTPAFTSTGNRCDGCIRVAPAGYLPKPTPCSERGLCVGCERIFRIQMLLSRLDKETEGFAQACRLLNLVEIYIADTITTIADTIATVPRPTNNHLGKWDVIEMVDEHPPSGSGSPYPPLVSIKAPPPSVPRTYPLNGGGVIHARHRGGFQFPEARPEEALGVAGGGVPAHEAAPVIPVGRPAQEAAPPAKKPPPPLPQPCPPIQAQEAAPGPPAKKPPPPLPPQGPPTRPHPTPDDEARPFPAQPPGPKHGQNEQAGVWQQVWQQVLVWEFHPQTGRLETVHETHAIGTPPERPEYSSEPERSGPDDNLTWF